MLSPAERQLLDGDPAAHPAALSWCAVTGARAPQRIEVLRGSLTSRRQRAVYRLCGGPGDAPVIAKRSPSAAAAVERRLYTLLADAQLAAPRLLGACGDGDHAWLFLEDGGAQRLDPADPGERRAVARWLARLHQADAPDAGLREHTVATAQVSLEQTRCRFEACRADVADRYGVAFALEQLAHLAQRWPAFVGASSSLPRAIVHGDFAAKNILMRGDAGRREPFVVDWEFAGRGTPAVDLGPTASDGSPLLDHAVYAAAIGQPESTVRTWIEVGTVLRVLDALAWAAASAGHDGPNKAMGHVQYHARVLARSVADAGWAR